jgi:general secretion pathway protein A
MYLDFFHLQEFPFSITPDPKYLYLAANHRAAFEHLRYGIIHRRGFIELTGEVGCGKSTICRAVLEHLGGQIKSALILNPCLNGLQLLRAILLDFGLQPPRQDRLSLLQTLNAFLLEQAADGVIVALIIDEAQDLPKRTMEEVRLLSNLETAQQKLIQIVLAGQPELQERLADPGLRQLRQRITVRYHIPPMAAGEIGGYIAHRLRTAGAPASLGFTEEAIARVARYSRGVPRLINALCDYALMAGFAAERHTITGECVARAEAQLEGRPA